MKSKLLVVSDYVAFDTETTGLFTSSDELLEIAGVKVIDGQIAETWQSFVKPDFHEEWDDAEAVNHISSDMVQNAPGAREAVCDFLEWADDLPLVGHNAAGFDSVLMEHALGMQPEVDLIDTYRICRRTLASENGHKLPAMYQHCLDSGVIPFEFEGVPHRALYDSYMTATVYEYFKQFVPEISTRSEYGSREALFNETTLAKREFLNFIRLFVTGSVKLNQSIACDLLETIEDTPSFREDKTMENVKKALICSTLTPSLTPDEEAEIMACFEKLSDPVVREAEDVDMKINGKNFIITGSFQAGSDARIMELISMGGGVAEKKNPTRKTDYVVVGNLGSPRWSFGNYGNKVDRAVVLQEQGRPIQIIGEDILISELKNLGIL